MKANSQRISAAFPLFNFTLFSRQTWVVMGLVVRHTSPSSKEHARCRGPNGRDLGTTGRITMPDTPVTWLDDFTANQNTTGTQFQPRITQLTNGNILVAWTSGEDSGAGSPDWLRHPRPDLRSARKRDYRRIPVEHATLYRRRVQLRHRRARQRRFRRGLRGCERLAGCPGDHRLGVVDHAGGHRKPYRQPHHCHFARRRRHRADTDGDGCGRRQLHRGL